MEVLLLGSVICRVTGRGDPPFHCGRCKHRFTKCIYREVRFRVSHWQPKLLNNKPTEPRNARYKIHVSAVCNAERGFLASNGMCPHDEQSHMDGLVIDCVNAYLGHGGRFEVSAEATPSVPADVNPKI